MKTPRWLPYAGMVAFYVTLFVILQIWSQPMRVRRPVSERVVALRKWSDLDERVAEENNHLRTLVVRDSVARTLPRPPGLYLELSADTLITATPAGLVAQGVRPVVEREAGVNPRAAIVIMGLPTAYGRHSESVNPSGSTVRTYGAVAGMPFCAVVLDATRRKAMVTGRHGVLGVCAFWSRYGAPGPRIYEWLARGGAHFAASNSGEILPGRSRIPPAARLSRQQAGTFMTLAGQACMAGRDEVCAAAVSSPDRIYGAPDSAFQLQDWDVRVVAGEVHLLSMLEHEFGAERFARFWGADQPFETAFRNAFGVGVGAWVGSKLNPSRRWELGARLGGDTVLLTLLFLGIVAGAALATAQRRRV